jgi:hypothetical protein
MRRRRWASLALAPCVLVLLASAAPAGAGEAEVTVADNEGIFSQNKQNEPAIAVDQGRLARGQAPLVLAAGSNDNIDMEACNAGDDTTCPFTENVGGSGIYFSFDGGNTWIQPQYTGWTARHCLGAVGGSDDPPSSDSCEVEQGPIGTLPRYDELGLVSDGDPALAFGPRPVNGTFSWANGSRLYYANLTSAVTANFRETKKPAFKGFEAIYVSRTDNPEQAAQGGPAGEAAWMLPVRVSRQSSATFADKEQIWADNAASSRFFGNVYVCWADFRGGGAAPLVVARSRDGGNTWAQRQVSPAHNLAPRHFGQSGCTVRTDSTGVVYVFYEEFENPSHVGFPPNARHMLVKSFDGGRSWTRPRVVERVVDPCYFLDPVIGRCVMDGVAGARSDLAASPSVDIANGAPSGVDATNLIMRTWVDGRPARNSESVMVSWSRNGGRTWASTSIQTAGDRGYYAAPGISPNGKQVYVVYNAFTTPFQPTTATPRGLVGVVKRANANGTVSGWTEVHRGAVGDPRGSSQNNLQAEFLGDYVYAVATRTYGAAVWNEAREASDCPAMDAWRQSLRDGTDVPRPAPQQDCAPSFGNTEIYAWTNAP